MTGALGRYGDGDDYFASLRAQGAGRGEHAGSCGQAVVDEDDGAAFDWEWGAPIAIGLLAPLDFMLFAAGDGFDCFGGDIEFLKNGVVGDDGSAAGDCAHGELFLAG